MDQPIETTPPNPLTTFCPVLYHLAMLSTIVYTPKQVAQIIQLSENTVYELINRGEIIAKKIGKVYRIPETSLYFALFGLDYDLSRAEREDQKNLPRIQKAITKVRSKV